MSKIIMAYGDKTFCPFKECNNFNSCHRALTDKVHEAAKEWWGGDNYPLAVYVNPPACYENESSD